MTYEGWFLMTAPILTVIGMIYPSPHSRLFEERHDADAAEDRKNLRLDARRREEDIAYWKGLATYAWNWLALPFSPNRLQSRKVQISTSRPHSHPTRSPATRISLYVSQTRQTLLNWCIGKRLK